MCMSLPLNLWCGPRGNTSSFSHPLRIQLCTTLCSFWTALHNLSVLWERGINSFSSVLEHLYENFCNIDSLLEAEWLNHSVQLNQTYDNIDLNCESTCTWVFSIVNNSIIQLPHGLPRWHSGLLMQETHRRYGFSLWVKISWSRKGQPTPVLLPKKSHGQRSLADYSP